MTNGAAEYDKDLAEEFEWKRPADSGGPIFAKHVPTGAKVLDAGAGTGLVGECLAQSGYRDLYAMDLSLGMLGGGPGKRTSTKSSSQMTLGEELGYETDSFDAVVSVGVFTTGHAPVLTPSTSWPASPSQAGS